MSSSTSPVRIPTSIMGAKAQPTGLGSYTSTVRARAQIQSGTLPKLPPALQSGYRKQLKAKEVRSNSNTNSQVTEDSQSFMDTSNCSQASSSTSKMSIKNSIRSMSSVETDNRKRIENLTHYTPPTLQKQEKQEEETEVSEEPVEQSTEEKPEEQEPQEELYNNSENPNEELILPQNDDSLVLQAKDQNSSSSEQMILIDDSSPIRAVKGLSVKDHQIRQRQVKEECQEEEDLEETDEERAYRLLFEKQVIPPNEFQEAIITRLRSEGEQALMDQEYERAAKIESLKNYVIDAYELQLVEQMKQTQTQTLEVNLERAKKNLERETKEWDRIICMFYDEQTKQRELLRQRQENEIEEFESEWADTSIMIPYTKASPTLLQVRKIQKYMAITKMYSDARQVKQIGDEIQQNETINAQEKAVTAMRMSYNNIILRQQKETECFNDHERRTEIFLKAEREKVLHPIQMQIKAIENHIAERKPPNLKPGKLPYTSNPRNRAMTRVGRFSQLSSPRTRHAFTSYKATDETPHLTINGLNVKQLINGRRPASHCQVKRTERK